MSGFKKIIEFDNAIQANMIEAVLNDRQIPFMIKSYHDSAYDGIFQTQLGWGCLEAPEEYEQEIKDLYDDLMKKDSD